MSIVLDHQTALSAPNQFVEVGDHRIRSEEHTSELQSH